MKSPKLCAYTSAVTNLFYVKKFLKLSEEKKKMKGSQFVQCLVEVGMLGGGDKSKHTRNGASVCLLSWETCLGYAQGK